MIVTPNGTVLRNLEEQVQKNKDDIADLQGAAVVLDEFGIKVVAQAETADSLPSPTDYVSAGGEFGDAYAIGTAAPYALWILTRSSTGPYWFNIGTFPAPGSTGPQGPIGPQGPQGNDALVCTTILPTPPIVNGTVTTVTANFNRLPNVGETVWAYFSTTGPVVYLGQGKITSVSSATVDFRVEDTRRITGATGPQGVQGATGATGPQGPIGPQGVQGPAGESFEVVGKVATVAELPDPSGVGSHEAYAVGSAEAGYTMYIVIDETWNSLGQFASVAGPQGPIGPQGPGPVTYSNIITDTLPPRYNWSYILPVANFNRTPAAAEQFYAVLVDTSTATHYLMLLERIDTPATTIVQTHLVYFVQLTGAQGPQGEQGQQGEQGVQGPGPVVYKKIWLANHPPSTSGVYHVENEYLNRIPEVGEQFYMVYEDRVTHIQYLLLATTMSTSDAGAGVSFDYYVQLTGDQGPQGASLTVYEGLTLSPSYNVGELIHIPNQDVVRGLSYVIPFDDNTGYYLVTAIDTSTVSVNSWVTAPAAEPSQVSISWADLVDLRDNSQLVPGSNYRITDYVCTTTQSGTQAASNVFDIIVQATGPSTLSEIAKAAKRAGTTYFDDSKLEAWELKYCLDNDASRFAWADETNGKGVVYWLKDEFNNECPYDFKNIQFIRYAVTSTTNPLKQFMVYEPGTQDIRYSPETSLDECVVEQEGSYYYTFSYILSSGYVQDLSIIGNKLNPEYEDRVHSNKMGVYYRDNYEGDAKTYLNNNVYCFTQVFYTENDDSLRCHSNTFGDHCYSNTLGALCYYNIFGSGCRSNIIGDFCYSNTWGTLCYDNILVSSCSYNIIGNHFNDNILGSNCSYNIFGNYCHDNIFEESCNHNIFGNECSTNTLGSNCSYNIFGNHCYSNEFGSQCRSNTLEGRNDHIILSSSGTQGPGNNLWNITLAQGLKGTSASSKLTITADPELDYQVIYRPAGSKIIDIDV